MFGQYFWGVSPEIGNTENGWCFEDHSIDIDDYEYRVWNWVVLLLLNDLVYLYGKFECSDDDDKCEEHFEEGSRSNKC